MDAEKTFEAQLLANPTDPLIRGIFGDWLMDHEDPRGAGYVAMGRLGLVPDMGADMPGYHDGTGTRRVPMLDMDGDTGELREGGPRIVPASPDSALPKPWFIACWGDTEDDVALCWVMGPVLKTIEDNVALAFLRLPPDLQYRYGVEGRR